MSNSTHTDLLRNHIIGRPDMTGIRCGSVRRKIRMQPIILSCPLDLQSYTASAGGLNIDLVTEVNVARRFPMKPPV